MASTDLVIVKLKPKKEFRGHVIFESMRPNYLDRFLRFWKEKNYLYSDIEISLHNISDTYSILSKISVKKGAFLKKC